MNPFSITLGVITLNTLASKAAVELKRLRSGGDEANNNVNAMLTDLKSLKVVLDLIEDGFEELDGRAPLTGHIGAHWSALGATLDDGCEGLERLEELLIAKDKEVVLLDDIQRSIRLKEANEQITFHRQEIQAYKDPLQLSFQSVTFFQQTAIMQDTTEILNRSYDLHQDLSGLAENLNVKLIAMNNVPP